MGSGNSIGILVDTNILLYVYDGLDPFWKIIDYFDYKPNFYVHKVTIMELNKLLEKYSGSILMQKKIRLALGYLEVNSQNWKEISQPEGNYQVDDILLDTASLYNLAIFTNDKNLKRKALSKGLKIIFLKGKGKIIKSYFPI
ncbi:twitching motility protein PilT [Candidatus Acidianus copahuensis]|uniref:Twitching motility protein PilT n=2 Tax=Candidatus Acidianus copahuensis TaxID=1160895 RepID=A0A031LJY9_9CREN|nr:twitching motility protein PilT [Candidatus Acidianus copahuensis]